MPTRRMLIQQFTAGLYHFRPQSPGVYTRHSYICRWRTATGRRVKIVHTVHKPPFRQYNHDLATWGWVPGKAIPVFKNLLSGRPLYKMTVVRLDI
jgi:hypothetical protein